MAEIKRWTFSIVGKWLSVYRSPSATFRNEKNNANLNNAIQVLGLAGFFAGLEICIFQIIARGSTAIIPFAVVMLIGMSIGAILFGFIYSAPNYVMCLILKGKGSFGQHFYLLSLISAPFLVIYQFFSVIWWFSLELSFDMSWNYLGIILRVIALYGAYLTTLAVDEIHEFGKKKAILSWLVPALGLLMMERRLGFFLDSLK
ncbi:MAG: hypothetical protein GXO65_00900 [Euryarchaeota archaeon]|nr:hypothetical protein [Euryarchaeota archaeon]